MKRAIILFTLLVLIVGLWACGTNEPINIEKGFSSPSNKNERTVTTETPSDATPVDEPTSKDQDAPSGENQNEGNESVQEPTPSSMVKKHIKTSAIENFGYWLYTPSDPAENMPLIVYLHGGSGKGNDLDKLISVDGFPKYLKDGTLGDVRAYVIMPQLPSDLTGWTNAKQPLSELIRFIKSNYKVDADRISLTGHSMGGTGTWGIALEMQQTFSRIAPMSGSVRTTDANVVKLASIPVWAFVGSADTIVAPDASINFVEALKQKNPNSKITVFDGATHFDVPALAYLDKEIDIVGWLIAKEDV